VQHKIAYNIHLRLKFRFRKEGDEFNQNSLNFKSQIGEIPILKWGRLEILKLLLIFLNNLKNSQHESCSTFWALQLSCWPFFKIPNRFWIGDSN
jgi:hypothetical protein